MGKKKAARGKKGSPRRMATRSMKVTGDGKLEDGHLTEVSDSDAGGDSDLRTSHREDDRVRASEGGESDLGNGTIPISFVHQRPAGRDAKGVGRDEVRPLMKGFGCGEDGSASQTPLLSVCSPKVSLTRDLPVTSDGTVGLKRKTGDLPGDSYSGPAMLQSSAGGVQTGKGSSSRLCSGDKSPAGTGSMSARTEGFPDGRISSAKNHSHSGGAHALPVGWLERTGEEPVIGELADFGQQQVVADMNRDRSIGVGPGWGSLRADFPALTRSGTQQARYTAKSQLAATGRSCSAQSESHEGGSQGESRRNVSGKGTGTVQSWSSLFARSGMGLSGSYAQVNEHFNLKFVSNKIVKGRNLGCVDLAEVDKLKTDWNKAMVFYPIGISPPIDAIIRFISAAWTNVARPKVQFHKDGYFLVLFQTVEECETILSGGPYYMGGHPIILKKWSHAFNLHDELRITPIWVRFPGLPVIYWGANTLSSIASSLGVPLFADNCTARQSRIDYARVLIEVNITKELPKSIWFYNEEDKEVEQAVTYEWVPPLCCKCQTIGHQCSMLPPQGRKFQKTRPEQRVEKKQPPATGEKVKNQKDPAESKECLGGGVTDNFKSYSNTAGLVVRSDDRVCGPSMQEKKDNEVVSCGSREPYDLGDKRPGRLATFASVVKGQAEMLDTSGCVPTLPPELPCL